MTARQNRWALLAHLILGVCFGITLTKAEAISWFRMQEMFRFQSFHMYGIIGAAVLIATSFSPSCRCANCLATIPPTTRLQRRSAGRPRSPAPALR